MEGQMAAHAGADGAVIEPNETWRRGTCLPRRRVRIPERPPRSSSEVFCLRIGARLLAHEGARKLTAASYAQRSNLGRYFILCQRPDSNGELKLRLIELFKKRPRSSK